MAKLSRADQLDQAVLSMLARRGAAAQDLDPSLAPLLRIAQELRDLPRENFKARLKSDLERKSSMATNPGRAAAKRQTATHHSVTPYLVVEDAPALVDFVREVFGAEETLRTIGSAGGVHAEVHIDDSTLMIGGGAPNLSWRGQTWPTALHIYVEDTDAAYQRALKAGAVSLQPPEDQFYGERSGGVKDPWGNRWYIATFKGEKYKPEGLRAVMPYLHPLRAEPVINFLKRGFGAEEVARYASPEGVIHHAQVRIGHSVVEMGEAHGPYQPMPTMFLLYVEDVDAAYLGALNAGAASKSEPADQPHGTRGAAVKDAFGNEWYISARI
jgi:PhnB protein